MNQSHKRKTQIGIFGGSFDPPHLGHLIVAEYVRAECGLKNILFVPAGQSPHKLQGPIASASDRVAMTRRAVKGNRAFGVSDGEIRRKGISYTVDTVNALVAENPGAELFLILGADSFADFSSWKSPDSIVSMATLLVYPRIGISDLKNQKYARHAEFIPAPQIEISSSVIRRRVATGKSIRYLVPEPVERYILSHGLYSQKPHGGRD